MVYFQWALRLVVAEILYHHQQKCIHYKWRSLTVYVITTKSLSTPPPTFFYHQILHHQVWCHLFFPQPYHQIFHQQVVLLMCGNHQVFSSIVTPSVCVPHRAVVYSFLNRITRFYIIRSYFRCMAITRSLPQSSLQVFVSLILFGRGWFGNVCF